MSPCSPADLLALLLRQAAQYFRSGCTRCLSHAWTTACSISLQLIASCLHRSTKSAMAIMPYCRMSPLLAISASSIQMSQLLSNVHRVLYSLRQHPFILFTERRPAAPVCSLADHLCGVAKGSLCCCLFPPCIHSFPVQSSVGVPPAPSIASPLPHYLIQATPCPGIEIGPTRPFFHEVTALSPHIRYKSA